MYFWAGLAGDEHSPWVQNIRGMETLSNSDDVLRQYFKNTAKKSVMNKISKS